MEKKEIVKEVITYLQMSFMDEKEKSMWLFLIPNMEVEHLEKLEKLLKAEASQKVDLFLEGYEDGVLSI
jgi:hypothetical protein